MSDFSNASITLDHKFFVVTCKCGKEHFYKITELLMKLAEDLS